MNSPLPAVEGEFFTGRVTLPPLQAILAVIRDAPAGNACTVRWGGVTPLNVLGIGSKRPWFHSVFHIFVVLGSLLQFLAIYFYAL